MENFFRAGRVLPALDRLTRDPGHGEPVGRGSENTLARADLSAATRRVLMEHADDRGARTLFVICWRGSCD